MSVTVTSVRAYRSIKLSASRITLDRDARRLGRLAAAGIEQKAPGGVDGLDGKCPLSAESEADIGALPFVAEGGVDPSSTEPHSTRTRGGDCQLSATSPVSHAALSRCHRAVADSQKVPRRTAPPPPGATEGARDTSVRPGRFT